MVGVPGFPHADLIGVAGVGGSGCTGVVGVVGLLPPPKRDANLSWSEARFLMGDAATGAGGTGVKAGPFFPGRAGDEGRGASFSGLGVGGKAPGMSFSSSVSGAFSCCGGGCLAGSSGTGSSTAGRGVSDAFGVADRSSAGSSVDGAGGFSVEGVPVGVVSLPSASAGVG